MCTYNVLEIVPKGTNLFDLHKAEDNWWPKSLCSGKATGGVCVYMRDIRDSILEQFAYMVVPPGPTHHTDLNTQLKVIEREQPTIKIHHGMSFSVPFICIPPELCRYPLLQQLSLITATSSGPL